MHLHVTTYTLLIWIMEKSTSPMTVAKLQRFEARAIYN
jgi:hypothetical protein